MALTKRLPELRRFRLAIERVIPSEKITKRKVDDLVCPPDRARVFLWDAELKGFGVAAFRGGKKTYFIQYRHHGRSRRFAIGAHGKLTADEARAKAKLDLAAAAKGEDPIDARRKGREIPTFKEASEEFMRSFQTLVDASQKKVTTYRAYRITLDEHLLPEIGSRRLADISDADMKKLRGGLATKKHTANKALALVSSIWNWAAEEKLGVTRQLNPTVGVKPYRVDKRERFLTSEELARLGDTLREGETGGLTFTVDETKAKSKHARKVENRRTKIDPHVAAAIRLLILTGARLREILNARWQEVDLERGALFLPDSKTGRKTVYLSAAAKSILASIPRVDDNPHIIAGAKENEPRSDLNRPWRAVRAAAKLDGVRIHDLRHSFASFGAGASLGLPIIGKLLGHTQAATTHRYAHLDADPLRRAVDTIGATIEAAMSRSSAGAVVTLTGKRRK